MTQQNSGKLIVVNGNAALAAQRRPSPRALIADFLNGYDAAPASRATYGRQLEQFCAWLDEAGITDPFALDGGLQSQDVLDFKRYLQARGKSPRTITGYLTAVRRFFAWLEGQRIYPNVARDVKGAKRPQGFAKDVLSKAQLRGVLNLLAERPGIEGLRDYALFNLLARTGLRTIEISRAQLGDIRQVIHPERGPVHALYVQGKGHDSKDDFVLLSDEAYGPVIAYLKARGPLPQDAPLFASHSRRSNGQALATRTISGIVKEALRAAGLDDAKLTAHSLRHTAITLAVLAGGSLHDAQAMARHRSPETTQGYFHNLKRVENAAEFLIEF